MQLVKLIAARVVTKLRKSRVFFFLQDPMNKSPWHSLFIVPWGMLAAVTNVARKMWKCHVQSISLPFGLLESLLEFDQTSSQQFTIALSMPYDYCCEKHMEKSECTFFADQNLCCCILPGLLCLLQRQASIRKHAGILSIFFHAVIQSKDRWVLLKLKSWSVGNLRL